MSTTNSALTANSVAPKNNTPARNHSERFTNKVLHQFGGMVAGDIQVTDYQRQLIQGYFIMIDRALKTAEENRVRKNENNKDKTYNVNLPATWENVNLADLALDVMYYARMGLDMMQDNHLFPIPYRNKKTDKYDVTLMEGYNGIQYIAENYAIDKPRAVVIELVHSTDVFTPLKRNLRRSVESYEFEITDAFNRGGIIGGFGYVSYDDPAKNKLIVMTMEDIEKRKPPHASPEFWGGKTKRWENGKQVDVAADGWFEEMCQKTLKREVYSAKHMPRDPKKVVASEQYLKMREARIAETKAQAEANIYANVIDIDTEPVGEQPPMSENGTAGLEAPTLPEEGAQTSLPGGDAPPRF